MNLDKNTRK